MPNTLLFLLEFYFMMAAEENQMEERRRSFSFRGGCPHIEDLTAILSQSLLFWIRLWYAEVTAILRRSPPF
jgi:hypothetical protein